MKESIGVLKAFHEGSMDRKERKSYCNRYPKGSGERDAYHKGWKSFEK